MNITSLADFPNLQQWICLRNLLRHPLPVSEENPNTRRTSASTSLIAFLMIG
jgi:hypothetical protein